MKLKKIIIINDNNEEEELDILDGTFLLVDKKDNGRIIASISNNQSINMQLIKTILK